MPMAKLNDKDYKRVLLVDADMVCFRACSACAKDVDWGNEIHSLYVDVNEAVMYLQEHMDFYVQDALEKDSFTGGKIKVVYCFSDRSGNIFRKKLLSTYKLNRVGKSKPIGYWALKKWVETNCETCEIKYLEADDVMGILATGRYKGKAIILSGDKDMKSIPTKVYNILDGTLLYVTPELAEWFHYYQTLIGDKADNYTGCPKVGPVKATRILEDQGTTWESVENMFVRSGLSKEDALIQARVSYILQDKDFKKGKVRLWTPPKKIR